MKKEEKELLKKKYVFIGDELDRIRKEMVLLQIVAKDLHSYIENSIKLIDEMKNVVSKENKKK